MSADVLTSYMEKAFSGTIKTLADALEGAASVGAESGSSERWTLKDLSDVTADFFWDLYGGEVLPSHFELAPRILEALTDNAFMDEDVQNFANSPRFTFLDIADYAVQLAKASGLVVGLKECSTAA